MSFKNINLVELKQDIENVRNILDKIPDKASAMHYWKIYKLSSFFYWFGLCTLPLCPFFMISWISLSLGIFSKWTMIGHHTCHGGYDTNKFVNFNRQTFGLKTFYKRLVDWFDWWLVEAWNIEHNSLHHYHLCEKSDPDLLEHNLIDFRNTKIPFVIKRLLLIPLACIWKWFYYAPNTYKHYCLNQLRKKDNQQYNKIPEKIHYSTFTLLPYITNNRPWMSGFFKKSLFPYFFVMFILIPFFYYLISLLCTFDISLWYVYSNLLLAEVCTNIHSFIIIGPNHTGDDLYRYDTPVVANTGEFYLRQIISSTNYSAGNDFIDFLQGWLNYQIEHHIFPNMSMLQYRYAMPMIKKICLKHKIPYVQENIWKRLCKTVDIIIGKTSMKIFINN